VGAVSGPVRRQGPVASVLVACHGDGSEAVGGLFELADADGRTTVRRPVAGLSCVVRHPFLAVAYGVSGRGAGVLHTWATNAVFDTVKTQPTGGKEPCHVAVHPSGRALIVVNYASGDLLMLDVDAAGVPADHGRLVELVGGGPVKGRQDSAHPHEAVFVRDRDRDLVLVPDLGADLLRTFTIDLRDGSLTPLAESPLPAGTGPRHLAYTSEGRVVLTGELSQTVAAADLDIETGRVRTWAAVASTGRDGGAPNYPGDLLAIPDTGVAYVANRGADTLASFDVSGPVPTMIEEVPLAARWPQHLAHADGALLVACRDSSQILGMPLTRGGRRAGEPEPIAQLPRPVWLAPASGIVTSRAAT
jgi:6-phosphogluconolactonase